MNYYDILERDRQLRRDRELLYESSFGDGMTWKLFSDGALSIVGTGRMPDFINHWNSYYGEGQAPWVGCGKYGVLPHSLVIGKGITYIGANSFESFGCLREVILADTVTSLGGKGFLRLLQHC